MPVRFRRRQTRQSGEGEREEGKMGERGLGRENTRRRREFRAVGREDRVTGRRLKGREGEKHKKG